MNHFSIKTAIEDVTVVPLSSGYSLYKPRSMRVCTHVFFDVLTTATLLRSCQEILKSTSIPTNLNPIKTNTTMNVYSLLLLRDLLLEN